MTSTDTPRVYVGTYAKYNDGNLFGKWLDLNDYADHDAFIEACHKLHEDEQDPELMFQDFEGFPRAFYSESSIKPELWDWLDLADSDRELLAAYQDGVDSDGDIEAAREAFMGTADSAEDFAAQWLEETGALESIPENLRNYFDYKAYARDMGFDGVVFYRHDNGTLYVFSPR